jgi:diguanylate cyclase (GGDEF)-like protein
MEQARRLSDGSARLAEERFRWIFTRMTQAAIPIHLALTALFIALGLTAMVWVNFGSMALHAGVWALLRNGRERAAFLLAVTNLVLLFVTATLLLGWASGFHYYLLVLPMLFVLHPGWSRPVKVMACTSAAGAYGLLALHAYFNGALTTPVSPGVDVLGVFNAVSFAATMSVLAFIVGKATGDAEEGLLHASVILEELSNRDPLTGLLNRRAIEALLQAAQVRMQHLGERYAVVMVDLDRFKRVNDSYGHACGDAVLGAVAGALEGAVRDTDHVARWGGEEFLILFPNSTRAGAHFAALKMLDAVRACSTDCATGNGIGVTATFGVAASAPSRSAAVVVRAADEALYAGKRSGRNCVVSEPYVDTEVRVEAAAAG